MAGVGLMAAGYVGPDEFEQASAEGDGQIDRTGKELGQTA